MPPTALDSAKSPLITESEAFALTQITDPKNTTGDLVAPNGSAQPMDALYVPRPSDAFVLPLDLAVRLAREDLAIQQGADIHDRDAMVRAAVTLEIRLRGLLAALDADGIGSTDAKRVAA